MQRTISTYILAVIPAVRLISAAEKRNETMLLSIIRYFNTWKRYGVAVDELSHLSDRELADIGITRSDIPRIAWEQSRHLA